MQSNFTFKNNWFMAETISKSKNSANPNAWAVRHAPMSTPAHGVKFVGLNGRAEEVADLSVNERWQALPSGWKVFAVERNVPASAAADASSSAAPASASKKHKDMFFQGPDMPSDKCLRSLTQVRLQLGLGEPAPHSPSAASTKKAKRAAPPSDASSGDDFEGDRDDDDAAAKDAKDAKGDQKAPRRRNKKKKKKAPRMMDSASYGKGSGDEDSDDDEVGLDADPSVGGGLGREETEGEERPEQAEGCHVGVPVLQQGRARRGEGGEPGDVVRGHRQEDRR